MKCSSLLLLIFGLFIFPAPSSAQTNSRVTTQLVWTDAAFDRSAREVLPDYFGLHHSASQQQRWPTVSFGAWRLDAKWFELEPDIGQWDFSALDRQIDLAEANGIDAVLILGQTPRWAALRPDDPSPLRYPGAPSPPRDVDDWENYVRTVVRRYRGRIRYYEVWNEPNYEWFFTGTVEDMLTLTEIVDSVLQEEDTDALIVSPSVIAADYEELLQGGSDWLDDFFSQGGGDFVDIVGTHFYLPARFPPEVMVADIYSIHRIMAKHGINKPLWNTETGFGRGGIFEIEGDDARGVVARAYLLQWPLGIERFFWYHWDDQGFVGLRFTESDRVTPTEGAEAYATIQDWLIGATMGLCQRNQDRTWLCPIARGPDYRGWIVWNSQQDVQAEIPDWLIADRVREMDGTESNLTGGQLLTINATPRLIERHTRP